MKNIKQKYKAHTVVFQHLLDVAAINSPWAFGFLAFIKLLCTMCKWTPQLPEAYINS